MPGSKKQVLLLVGPTASGKTRLSLEIAEKCNGEIVSADSRLVYRQLDIGTAKPTLRERKSIPHHCIDIKDPDEFFSAGEYGKFGRRVVAEIHSRDRLPIVVGGSGLYIEALVDGLFSGDYRSAELREKLKLRAEDEGLDVLYNRLCGVDPDSAQKIHPNDQKRIIRALEMYELSGEPMSRIQKEKTESADFIPLFRGLRWARETIYHRIEERVDKMIESGLIDEVRRLREQGYGSQYNSLDSVGYKEVFACLDGLASLEETVDLIKQNTRRFAKKQITWFRRDSRIQWIDVQEPVDWDGLAQRILNVVRIQSCSPETGTEANTCWWRPSMT